MSIFDILTNKFKDSVEFSEDHNCLFIKEPSKWDEISLFIKDDKRMKFNYLMCVSGYDLDDGNNLGIAYNFSSTELKTYLEVRIEFSYLTHIPSVTPLWRAADWHEREAYDLFGILFDNHPDMKRILLPDDWEGYPLRKDYKTPEYYKGMPVPKDKSYWE
jgi:NADH-quinone oxidoreductase subunit C